jgi:hypothetical protein
LKKIRQIVFIAFIKERHIAPLATLRVVFGAVMFISAIRFMMKGWITQFYIKPSFHFTFYGFDWVKPLNETGMYVLFVIMIIASLGIMLGYFYRLSIAAFFISFIYVELLDKTYYLNHYYLVSLVAFLLLIVPANRYFALDVWRKPSIRVTHVPGWTIMIFQLQLLLVYFFAGISKINYPWLMEAMPLKIWLPANEHLPVIGSWLKEEWVAYLFSWFGALYDLSIGFLLMNKRTTSVAFVMVVIFHVITSILFKIGMFPYIMIAVTIIFFSGDVHQRLIEKIRTLLRTKPNLSSSVVLTVSAWRKSWTKVLLIIYFVLQIIIPFRYLFYPGDLLWTEEGYRFSWRVMLMEKGGIAFFYIRDPETRKRIEVPNSNFLTSFQEKMMATQPDMILQYAHFLDEEYRRRGIKDPVITVQSYVTLNGKGSHLFIDSAVDLSRETESFYPKLWILSQDQMNTRQ